MREMRAGELMTPNPITVNADASIQEVARAFRTHNIGFLPVVESEQDKTVLGVITDRDIAVRCTAEGHDPASCHVRKHMTDELITARPGDDIRQVMDVMEGAQIRRLPVVDERGRAICVIAQADLAVEAVEEDAVSPLDVAAMLEAISKPARPERKGIH